MDQSLMPTPPQRNATRFACAVLVIGFILALLPLAGNYIMHNPDERHYSDGALTMLKHGQWLSPRWADGTYRFRKPILPYWASAAGMAMFGFSALGARVLFLLATAAVVYMTYRIALFIYRDRRAALLAGAIVATNGVLLPTASRSMPDGLLVCFLTLSILGFTAILVAHRTERRWYWMAYLGAGLALASKGGLGILVVAYFFLVAFPARRTRPVRSLLHMPSIITGLVVGLGWYVAVFVIHGSDMWHTLWNDQVGRHIIATDWYHRVWSLSHYSASHFVMFDSDIWTALWTDQARGSFTITDFSQRAQSFFYHTACYFLQFLPWLLILPELLLRNRGMFLPRSPRHRFADRVALGWLIVVAIVFSFSKGMSDRYTLPAVPLGAVLLAGLVHRADPHKFQFQLARGLKLTLTILILVAAVLAWINLSLGLVALAITLSAGVLLLAAILLLASRNERCILRSVALALAMLALVPTICLGFGHLILPDQGEQIARTIQRQQLLRSQPNSQPIVMIGSYGLASKIRLFASADVDLQTYPAINTPGARQALRSAECILASRQVVDVLGLAGWHQVTAAQGIFAHITTADTLNAIRQGTFAEFIRAPRTTTILAYPEPPPPNP